jgi:hypothetical protein
MRCCSNKTGRLKLLLDNNPSPALSRCLEPLFPEHKISALRDFFNADTPDVEWISTLSTEGGWAVLTKDLHICTRPHERLALDRSKIVYFFLSGAWKRYSVPETAARLIRLVPLMVAQTSIAERGRFELPINPTSKLRPHRD